MESPLDGAAGESPKCGEMSVAEKRQLVYELSKQSHLATEVLQAWSRQEILQILCAEMGKERKYTGLTKVKIIEALLKIVSDKKNSGEHEAAERRRDDSDFSPVQRNPKRQRKVDNPARYVAPSSNNASGSCNSVNTKAIYCNNLACRAVLRQDDSFCLRCSCCVCRKYDDNKDPSLWLTCSSDAPFLGDSCGSSCHLACAFNTEKSGLATDNNNNNNNRGSCFYCVSCGKPNSLLESLKKQLTIAKETRRVDVLCFRLFLVQRLLKGSTKHPEAVNEAVKCLEADVGPLTGLSTRISRGIVNRLQSGPNVQRLCSEALESLEEAATTTPITVSRNIRFEDVNATSLAITLASIEADIVHYSVWHRKASTEKEYPEKSTCTLFTPKTRFVVSGLAPASEYCFKVVAFSGTREVGVEEIAVSTTARSSSSPEEGTNCSRSESPLTNCSTLSSVEAESNNGYKKDSSLIEEKAAKETENNNIVLLEEEDKEETPVPVTTTTTTTTNLVCNNRNSSDASLPITPFRSDETKNRQGRTGKSVKDNNGDHHSANGGAESGLEHCVKVIRQLECSGHIERDFRQKFLTWFSLRATQQEIRVVKIFIDAFSDDPVALAEQLVHTFEDRVSVKRSAIGGGASAFVPSGFCMKLWH